MGPAFFCNRELISRRVLRGKIYSSLGGRKAHLDFELKDQRPPEAVHQSKSDLSDFDITNTDLGSSRDRCVSLTSMSRYAGVCHATNGKLWLGRPSPPAAGPATIGENA
jgi:hypothetical protein